MKEKLVVTRKPRRFLWLINADKSCFTSFPFSLPLFRGVS